MISISPAVIIYHVIKFTIHTAKKSKAIATPNFHILLKSIQITYQHQQ